MTTDDALFSAIGRMVVLVDDPDEALAFYRDVLGFAVLHDYVAGGYRFLHIGLPGQEGVGLWLMPITSERQRELVGRQTGGQPLLVLYTADLAVVAKRLRDHAYGSGTNARTPTVAPCTSPTCTATSSSWPSYWAPEAVRRPAHIRGPAAVRGGCRAGSRAPVGRSSPDQ